MPGSRVLDAGGLEVEPVDDGAATGSDQKMAAVDCFGAAGAGYRDVHSACRRRQPVDACALPQVDAVFDQASANDVDQFRLVLRQDARHLHDRDVTAQPAVGLRHFDADRPTADDDQMRGPFGVVEDGLVGEVGHAIETRYRRNGRHRSGRHHDTARADTGAVFGLQFARAGEASGLLDHAHAEPRETFD